MVLSISQGRHDASLIVTAPGLPTTHVPGWVIDGVCDAVIHGRDAEDGFAPLYVIASIIEHATGTAGYAFQMPPIERWGEWMRPWEDTGEPVSEGAVALATDLDSPTVQAHIRDYDITPMVVALGRLAMFGGEDYHACLGPAQ